MQIGFAGLLTLLFVAAKLFGYVSWSWLWVFSPLWLVVFSPVLITLALSLAIMAFALVVAVWAAK